MSWRCKQAQQRTIELGRLLFAPQRLPTGERPGSLRTLFLLINEGTGIVNQANMTAQATAQQASLEHLVFNPVMNSTGSLVLVLNNTGDASVTVVAAFVADSTGKLVAQTQSGSSYATKIP